MALFSERGARPLPLYGKEGPTHGGGAAYLDACMLHGQRAIVAAEQREIELYETYKAHVSYGVYIARKVK